MAPMVTLIMRRTVSSNHNWRSTPIVDTFARPLILGPLSSSVILIPKKYSIIAAGANAGVYNCVSWGWGVVRSSKNKHEHGKEELHQIRSFFVASLVAVHCRVCADTMFMRLLCTYISCELRAQGTRADVDRRQLPMKYWEDSGYSLWNRKGVWNTDGNGDLCRSPTRLVMNRWWVSEWWIWIAHEAGVL